MRMIDPVTINFESIIVGSLVATQCFGELKFVDSNCIIKFIDGATQKNIDIVLSTDLIKKLTWSSQDDEYGHVLEFRLKPKGIKEVGKYLKQINEYTFRISQCADERKFEIYIGNLEENGVNCISLFMSYFDDEPEPLKSLTVKKPRKTKRDSEDSDAYFPHKRARKRTNLSQIETIVIDDDDDDKGGNERVTNKRNLRSRNREEINFCEDVSEESQLEEALKRSLREVDQNTIESVNLDESLKSKEPDPYADIDKTIELFIYDTNMGQVIVRMEDYICLSRNEYLSDVIIDFYLHYIYSEKMTAEQRDKVFIFGTHFYTLYALSSEYSGWNGEENAGLNAKEKRYRRIDGLLRKDVNIFEKEFLVIPLMDHNHWFLCMVCFPKLQGSYTFDGLKVEGDEKRNPKKGLPAIKTSCILIFDSIKGNGSRRNAAISHIKNFLEYEWQKKYKDVFPFDTKYITGHSPKVPRQMNNVDCGCFMLEFMERFFVTSPIYDFRLPINLHDWFSSEDVRVGKRREIADVICLMAQESGVELPTLRYVGDSQNSNDIPISNGEYVVNGNNNDQNFNNNNDYNCLDSNSNFKESFLNDLNPIPNEQFNSGRDESRALLPISYNVSTDLFTESESENDMTDKKTDLNDTVVIDETDEEIFKTINSAASRQQRHEVQSQSCQGQQLTEYRSEKMEQQNTQEMTLSNSCPMFYL